jgi:hypothetical protein
MTDKKEEIKDIPLLPPERQRVEFDRVRLQFDLDTLASHIFMNDGTVIPLKEPFHFDEGVPYDIVLLDDFTVEIWRLMSTDNEHKVN